MMRSDSSGQKDDLSVLLDRILLYVTVVFASLALMAFMWFAVRLAPALGASLRRTPSRAAGFCPTPRANWWSSLLLPYRVFLWQTCGYDLSRQPPVNELNEVRCPECGCITEPRRLHRARYRLRPGRVSFACSLVGTACLAVLSARGDRWVRWTPTIALIGIQESGVSWQEESMRSELYLRVHQGATSTWAASHLASLLVTDLRDDDTRGNAGRARWQLLNMGQSARPALLEALRSSDRQQRQYAFVILGRLDRRNSWPATGEMIEAAIESLADDDLRDIDNAVEGFGYLYRHGGAERNIRRRVVDSLTASDDPQQRLLCAVLCGRLHCVEGLAAAYPILVDCLKDDGVSEDGSEAAAALYAFGPQVVPLLDATMQTSTDAQQRLIISLILFDLGAASAPAVRPRVPNQLTWEFRAPLNELLVNRIPGDDSMYWLYGYVAAHRR